MSHTSDAAVSRSSGGSLEVLILDGENRQALAALRSYARGGLRVGAATCDTGPVQCFSSRWCVEKVRLSPFADGTSAFADSLDAVLRERGIAMVLPTHDGSIEAIRQRRTELERRTHLALAAESALAIAVSKPRTLHLAAELGIGVPRSILISDPSDIRPAGADLGFPLVVKPSESWAKNRGQGKRISPEVAANERELEQMAGSLLDWGVQPILQERLSGHREAVTVLYSRGRFHARFAQRSYRELPIFGGASVMCEGIPIPADIGRASDRIIHAMNLEGCSMVEFRRNAAGVPMLMEVNPRMPGSVALAIRSGVDFPMLTYDWAVGRPIPEVTTYRPGRRLRWLAGDVWNLKFALEEPKELDAPGKWPALRTFFTDFAMRPAALDPFWMSDPKPGLREMRSTVGRYAWGRIRERRFVPARTARTDRESKRE